MRNYDPVPMKLRCLLPVLLLVQTAYAQKSTAFLSETFNRQLETARWMVEYDSTAWRLSELVTTVSWEELGRMGREWFCYKSEDSLWNGVYGKYKNGVYDVVLHYKIWPGDSIDVVCDPLDTAMLGGISRAINTAYSEAGFVLGRSYVKFNKFVRYHADKTVSVWLLPALQPNEIAMYGGEFYYLFDETGTRILGRQEYYQGSFKGFRLGKAREVQLHYDDADAPTQGAVFFALKYGRHFSGVYINTRHSTSLLAFSREKGYYWRHADKAKTNP